MEGERDNIDQFFQDRFATFERSPSKSVWAGIKKHGLMANGARLVFLGNYGFMILLTIATAGVILLGSQKNNLFGIVDKSKPLTEQTIKPENKSQGATITADQQETKQGEKENQKEVLTQDSEKKQASPNEKEKIKESAENGNHDNSQKNIGESNERKGAAHSGVSNLANGVNGSNERQFIKTNKKSIKEKGLSNQKNAKREPIQSANSLQDNFVDNSSEEAHASLSQQVDPTKNEFTSSATHSDGVSLSEEVDGDISPLPIVNIGLGGDMSPLKRVARPAINGDIRLTKSTLSIAGGMAIANPKSDNDSIIYRGWALSLRTQLADGFNLAGGGLSGNGLRVNGIDVAYYLSKNSFLELSAATNFRIENNFRLTYNHIFGNKRIKPMVTLEVNSQGNRWQRINLGVGLMYDIVPEGRWRLFSTASPDDLTNPDFLVVRLGVQYRFTKPSNYQYDKLSSEYKWYVSMAYLGDVGKEINGGRLPAYEVQVGKYLGDRTFLNASFNSESLLGFRLEHYFLSKPKFDLGIGLGVISDTKRSFTFDPLPEIVGYYKLANGWRLFGRYAFRRSDNLIVPQHIGLGVQKGIFKR